MYTVIVEQRVYKDFDRIPSPDLDKIYETIESLENNPRKPGSQKLRGYKNRYRIRRGDYRIIYTIDDSAKIVNVFLVKHRKDAYQDW